MGKGTSCLDISCHWRLFYPTEIRISTTGKKKINYYPAKLANMLPLVPTSSSGKFNPVSITSYWDGGVCMHAQVLICLTLRDPMDCSPPVFPVYEIFQTRILEWVELLG